MARRVGYHENCGGTVRGTWVTLKKEGRVERFICGRCHAPIHPPHALLSEQPVYPRQKTAGVKRRRKRYDYSSWKDVK